MWKESGGGHKWKMNRLFIFARFMFSGYYLGESFLALLALALLIQLYYFFRYFIKLARYNGGRQLRPRPEPVSVIIVARNEFKNLEAYLQSVLEQDYPDYEVVVVNNGSWDKSQEFLEEMEERYHHLRVVKIVEQEKYPKGKKFGLTLGIKAARYEWLLLTDSDCMPVSRRWISEMQAHFTQEKSIVLGYSPYIKKSSLLNLFIRFETFYTALQYLSFALAGKAYMGVGRNLAYRKSLFFSVKGFASHNHVISGDDDLFINETATASNTDICITPESFVYSVPKENGDDWYRQKRRHLSTGKYYSRESKRRLAGLSLSLLLFYPSLAVALIFFPLFYVPLGLYGVRLISQMFIYGFAMKRLKETKLLFFLPLLDIMYFFYYGYMGMITLFSRKRRTTW